jgi:predicted DCC family thiol-disulfide oxidoreductase YuxK
VSALPNQEPGAIERYGLTREDVDRYAWAIEPSGRRYRGAAAVARTLREMGGGWRALGWLARLPGATLVYTVVARMRARLSALWGDPPPYPD